MRGPCGPQRDVKSNTNHNRKEKMILGDIVNPYHLGQKTLLPGKGKRRRGNRFPSERLRRRKNLKKKIGAKKKSHEKAVAL